MSGQPPPRTMHTLAIVLSAVGAVAFLILIVFVVELHAFMSALDPKPNAGYPIVTTPLTITATPRDATIFIDGVSWGKPPVTIPAASIGATLEVRAELPGHTPAVERVLVRNQHPPVHLTLPPAP